MAQRTFYSKGSLWKSFLFFLLPLILTNILQNLSGTINTIFIGQMIGVKAVAAVSVFFPILFCLMAFIIGLASGCTILISQAWGAKDYDKLRQVFAATLFLTTILGGLIAFCGVLLAPYALEALHTDPSILPLAVKYMQFSLAGSPILFIYIIMTSIIRGVGDSVTPLLSLVMTMVAGIVLTPSLIQGYMGLPKMGILSPAIANMFGYFLVLVFLFFYLRYKNHPLKIDAELFRHFRYQPTLSRMILKLSIPTGIQMVTMSLAGLVIVGLINSFGANATAAYGAVNQVINFVQFPAISIGIAASIFAGQAIGADQSDMLRKITRTALWFNLILTGGLISLVYIGSKYLMALFITDESIILMGQRLLHTVLWSLLFFGAGSIFAAIMRSSGTVIPPMLITLGTILTIEVPLAYWFSSIWGLQGIWIAYTISFMTMCILQFVYYQWVWRKKSIKKLL